MNAATKIEATTAIWDALSRTDPAHTKQFKRAGGFSGTALKPIWIVKRLTEQFGPVGIGWGMDHPQFQTVQGHNGEVLVYCTVRCWHTHPDNTFFGVGGDKVVTYIKPNEQYKRPERWENDDEAFKKAFTDAVGNAFKFVGVGADIHMGQFEDSKYVRMLEREFAAGEPAGGQSEGRAVSPRQDTEQPRVNKGWREPDSIYSTPTKLHAGLTRHTHDLKGCGDSSMIYGLCNEPDWREFCRVAEKHAPHYLHGGPELPPEWEGLLVLAERMVKEFDTAEANQRTAFART